MMRKMGFAVFSFVVLLLYAWGAIGQYVAVPFTHVSGGGGTPTVVQWASNSASMNFGSGSVTLGSAATVGDVVIVEFYQGATSNTVTVTDNNGHGLTQSAAANQALNCCFVSGFLASFSYVVPASGTTTFNFTFTGSFADAYVIEVSNLSSATLQAYSADVGPATNPSPSATPTSSPSLALGVYTVGSGTPTAGTGWTGLGTPRANTLWVEYKAVTGTSAVTATISGVSNTDAWAHIW